MKEVYGNMMLMWNCVMIPFFERAGLAFPLVTPESENGWKTIIVIERNVELINRIQNQ